MKGTRFRAAVLVTTQNVINATSRHDTVSFMLVYRPGSHALAYRRNRLGLVWAKYFGFEIRFEIIIDRDQSPQAMAATDCCRARCLTARGRHDQPGRRGRGQPMVNLACPHGVVNYGATVFTFFSRWLTGADQLTAVADAVKRAPGLRHFTAPLWPVSASSSSLGRLLARGEAVALCVRGCNPIWRGCTPAS